MKNTLDENDEGKNIDERDANDETNGCDDDFVVHEKNVKIGKEEIEKPVDFCLSKLEFVSKLEKLIYVRKVVDNLGKHSDISSFIMCKYGLDNEHKLEMPDVPLTVLSQQLNTLVDNPLLSHDGVTKLDIFKKPGSGSFPWKPGDQSCTFCSVLFSISSLLMCIHCVLYTAVLQAYTTMANMFKKFSVFPTASASTATDANKVDLYEKHMVKNIVLSEVEEYKHKEQVMQEFVFFHVMDSQELKLLCDEPLAEDKLVNLHYGTSTNLSKKEFKDCKTELLDKESKEFLFPDLLDRTWDELEGYKVELFDNKPALVIS